MRTRWVLFLLVIGVSASAADFDRAEYEKRVFPVGVKAKYRSTVTYKCQGDADVDLGGTRIDRKEVAAGFEVTHEEYAPNQQHQNPGLTILSHTRGARRGYSYHVYPSSYVENSFQIDTRYLENGTTERMHAPGGHFEFRVRDDRHQNLNAFLVCDLTIKSRLNE